MVKQNKKEGVKRLGAGFDSAATYLEVLDTLTSLIYPITLLGVSLPRHQINTYILAPG